MPQFFYSPHSPRKLLGAMAAAAAKGGGGAEAPDDFDVVADFKGYVATEYLAKGGPRGGEQGRAYAEALEDLFYVSEHGRLAWDWGKEGKVMPSNDTIKNVHTQRNMK